jgi:Na+/melibiose symporter-like transporter
MPAWWSPAASPVRRLGASCSPWPFGFDAATFLVAALLALGLRTDLTVPADTAGKAARRFRTQIAEGVRWLWRHRQLRAMCLLLTLWNLVESAVFAILVLWALEVLLLPKAAYGALLTGLAAGGVLGSLLADRLGRGLGAGRSIAASLWGSVLAYLGLGLTGHGVVAFVLLALVGAAADHFGLRAPFLLAAALLGIAGVVGLPHLRTARLVQARAAAAEA